MEWGDSSEAVALLDHLDWPGVVDTCELDARAVWIPVHRTRLVPTLRSGPKWLEDVRVQVTVPLAAYGKPKDHEACVPSSDPNALLVPFWLVMPKQFMDGPLPARRPCTWATVDPVLLRVTAGLSDTSIPRARGRLVFLLATILISATVLVPWVSTLIAFPLHYLGLGLRLGDGLLWGGAMGAVLLLAAYLAYRFRFALGPMARVLIATEQGVPASLLEPVERAQTGLVRLPLDVRWLKILPVLAGALFLAGFVRIVGAGVADIAGFGPWFRFLAIGAIGCAVAAGGLALLLRSGHWLEKVSTERGSLERVAPGRSAELVRLTLRVAVLSLLGGSLGKLIGTLQLGDLWHLGILDDATLIRGVAARTGALLAVALEPLRGRAKLALITATVAEGASQIWVPDWAAGPALFFAMLVIVFPAAREIASERGPTGTAVRLALGFTLGSALGRVIGKTVGLGLGGVGLFALGEVMGDHAGANLGFLLTRNRLAPRSPPPEG